MKEIKCPVCNAINSEDAESCHICGVKFDRLPQDILPENEKRMPGTDQPVEPPHAPSAGQDAEIPQWLSDIMQRSKKTQGKMEFDTFANVLFGKETAANPKSIRKDDLSGNEKIEDLLPPKRRSIQELSDVPLEIPDETEAEIPDEKEDRKYGDFSYFRPAPKWDEEGIPTSSQAQESIENDTDPDDAPAAIPVTEPDTPSISEEDAASETKTDHDPQTDSDPTGTIDEKNPEGVIFTVALLPDEELDPKLKPNPSETENSATVNETAVPPASQPMPVEPDEPLGAAPAQDEPEGSSLVDEFLASLNNDEPTQAEKPESVAAEPEPIEEEEEEEPSALPAAENMDADAPEETQEPEAPTPELTSDPKAESESEPAVPEVTITPGIASGQRLEDLNAIPWDLFENNEVSVPFSDPDAEYKTFSRNLIQPDKRPSNYQQRMILVVLQKLFQLEARTVPLDHPAGRRSNKLLQGLLALVAIAGVITLLMTGITDFIQLSPVSPERLPALTAFTGSVTELQPNQQVLLVLDFPPGYGNELLPAAQTLVEKISAQHAKVRLVTTSPLAEIHSQKILRESPALNLENFGYLPGSAIAIQQLTVSQRNQMDAVYIISSDSESLRTWIEQLSFAGISVPVNVIASAQMGPLVKPYLQSGRIHTLISAPIEKNVFAGNTFSDQYENRKLFAIWYLCLLALLILLTGSIEFAAEKTIAASRHPVPAEGKADAEATAFQEEKPSDAQAQQEQGERQ